MSAVRCVLEVMDSHGEIVARARIETVPVTIGRGYGCDLIVDDPYMDPVHVRIVEDGEGLVAEDAGSTNGLRANGSNELAARVPLVRGTVLHVGRSTIRYLDPAEPAAPALRDRPAAWNAPLSGPSLLNSRVMRAGVVIACLLVVALHKSEIWFDPAPAAKTAGETLAVLLMMVTWAGIWAGAAKMARHPAMFSHHLAITSLSAGLLLILFYVEDWCEFLWPDGYSIIPMFAFFSIILIAAVYAQLGLSSSLRRWWRLAAAVALPVAGIALIAVIASEDDSKFSTKMKFDGQLKPVPAHLVPAISVDEFKTRMAKVKESVEKELRESDKKK